MIKGSTKGLKWRTGEPSRHSHKQKLASEYNFMLFRATGARVFQPHNRKVSHELQTAINAATSAIRALDHCLRKDISRQAYMILNSEERKMMYKNWHIEHNPKPGPRFNHDWDVWHEDFDGAPDSGDRRSTTAGSSAEAIALIDEYISEHGEE